MYSPASTVKQSASSRTRLVMANLNSKHGRRANKSRTRLVLSLKIGLKDLFRMMLSHRLHKQSMLGMSR